MPLNWGFFILIMTKNIFYDDFSKEVWQTTFKDYKDDNLDDTFRRVAKAVAKAEKDKEYWEDKFYELFSDFKFTVGGRVYSNAGTEWTGTTWHNCFVGPKPNYDQDSIEGILQVLFSQVKTLKAEGGWGMNFSFIRPRGSFIKGIGVESPGSVKYMELFDKSSEIITAGSGSKSRNKKSKGKIRKGAMMAMLFVWHPDVEEFITAKLQEGRLTKFNISVACTDEFMDRVVAIDNLKKQNLEVPEDLEKWDLVFPDTNYEKYKEEWNGNINKWKEKGYPVIIHKTVRVSDLWEKIITSTYTRNDPGIFFPDRANYTHCWNYGKNSEIQASNPCVIEGTLVNTPYGYKKVEDINVGELVCTVSGVEPVESVEINKDYEVYKVEFSDGGVEFVTESHIYHTLSKGSLTKKVNKKPLKEINIGDRVVVSPSLIEGKFDKNEYNNGLKAGILLGDGCYTEKCIEKNFVKIACNKDEVEYIKNIKVLFGEENFNKDDESKDSKTVNLILKFNKSSLASLGLKSEYSENKFIDYNRVNNKSFLIGLLDGLLATDGNVNLKSNHPQIRFDTSSLELAQQIRRFLLYLEAHGFISTSNSKGGTINNREIIRKHLKNTITISGYSIKKFLEVSLISELHPQKGEKLYKAVTDFKLSGNCWHTSIKSITKQEGRFNVYDIYCRKSDTWITSGYVQRGCGEQSLPFGANCDLGSMNLVKYFCLKTRQFLFDKFKQDVKKAVRVLDNINEVSPSPLPEYTDSMRHRRRIGLGVMGWASLLYLMKIRFSSDEAYKVQQEIMKVFTHSAVEASIELAEEKGMFRDCEPEKHANHPYWRSINLSDNLIERMRKSGIRNSALFSIQPTGNTGVFANIVSGGLEPIFGQEWIRTVIVNSPPDEILEFVPKYWEGDFKPNKYFKTYKEGSDEILRYVHTDETVYKIDKNRGLTKEVLCQDYSVRVLKELGEWNPKADWAITAFDLTVKEHVKDMEGFAKWIDSSISKTINVKNDYPFEDFKDIYLDAYKGKILKGITTYREGTMANVLALKIDVKKPCNNAPKREKILDCDIYSVKVKGEKFFVIIGLLNGPYEVFAGRQDFELDKLHSSGRIEKVKRGQYRLLIGDEIICENVCDHLNDEEEIITRLVSTGLRHSVDLNFLVHQIEKSQGALNSLGKAIARCLKKYIEDGVEVTGEDCPECGGKLQRKEGCASCQCGFSKCG